MAEVHLPGCATEPLGAYLKALGVLRAVGEGPDAGARGWWQGDGFVLSSALGADELVWFLLCEWPPTPIASPWNSGGGLGSGGKSPAAVAAVAGVEGAVGERFEPYRRTLAAARRAVEVGTATSDDKEALIERCRGVLPDRALAWLDTAVVLAEEGPQYPPLLGSGGNLGRLDLSVNFMQRLAEAVDLSGSEPCRPPKGSEAWLRAALFRDRPAPLVPKAVGQYDPGRRGGVNSSPLGDAGSLVNPWDFVLTLEGALLFAAGAARRMGAGARGTAAIPFTVETTPVGYPDSTAGEKSRGEIWAPVWGRPATVAELGSLLGEGRAQWGRRQSRTGLDFARAVAALGVARGIDSFVRHAIVERFGQDMLAVPVGRVQVRERPAVTVLAQLDPWLDQVRRAPQRSAAVATALRRVEATQFAVAVHGGARRLQDVLVATAALEQAVGHSGAIRDRVGPVTGLGVAAWVEAMDGSGGSSTELRLAVALASSADRQLRDGDWGSGAVRVRSLRTILCPVQAGARQRLQWAPGGELVAGLGSRALADVLAEALRYRAIWAGAGDTAGMARGGVDGVEAGARSATERDGQGRVDQVAQPLGGGGDQGVAVPMPGPRVAFGRAVPAALGDVSRWLDGQVDEAALGRLLSGLVLLDWSAWWSRGGRHRPGLGEGPRLVGPALPAWAVLAPFLDRQAPVLRPEQGWAARLCAGQVAGVISAGLRRLRMAGIDVAVADAETMSRGVDGRRLAAALLVPLRPAAYRALGNQVAPPERAPVASGSGHGGDR